MKSGHYYYITKQKDTWYNISDDKVTQLSEDEALIKLENYATILGYKEDCKINSKNLYQESKTNQEQPKKQDSLGQKSWSKSKFDIIKKYQNRDTQKIEYNNSGLDDKRKNMDQNSWKIVTRRKWNNMNTSNSQPIPQQSKKKIPIEEKLHQNMYQYFGRPRNGIRKTYIKKPENSYYDPSKCCFYIPKYGAEPDPRQTQRPKSGSQ